MASSNLKKNYRCVPSLQQFYTGGPFAVSSDGSFLACACDDKIKIVDSSNATIKATLEGDEELITALVISPSDKLLFSASHSKLIRVWDLSSLQCQRSWKAHDGPVMSMVCDASGGLLATGGSDRKVLVWDVDGGYCTHHFQGHKGVVTTIMFHPDPSQLYLFSGSDDATVRIWNLQTKKCIAVLEKHFSTVTSTAFSDDGWTLLTAGRDKVVNVWNLRDYSFMLTIPTYEVLEAVCVINPGSTLDASLGQRKPGNKKQKKTDSTLLSFLTVGERGIIRIWKSEGAVCIYEQPSSDIRISLEKDDVKRGFTKAVVLPMDQGLLCVTADQQFLFYCREKNMEEIFDLKLNKRLIGYNEEIVDLKFMGEEEQFLAVATNLEQVRVYDLVSMSCSYVLSGHRDTVLCLDTCVSITGKTLLVTGSKDNTVRLWDQESRCCIGVGTGHMGAVGAVAFSKKGRNFFVSGSCDRTIKVWPLDGISEGSDEIMNMKAKAVVAAHDKDINSLAISPNDNLVCSGSQDRTACVRKLPDLVSVVVLRGHRRGIWSVEFSPVDQCVITSSGDKTIKIWAISDGSCLKTFEGHTSSVLRVSFLTRGSQFVSTGADGLVKLWTIRTNECIATYDCHEDKVWALAVGKKTEMLATGGGDAVVNLWHDCTSADREEAFRKEEEEILRGQELENAVTDADFKRAIQLAFELRRPHKLFEIFADLCRKRDSDDQVDKALSNLGKEDLSPLFGYLREWNTKPKLCHVTQFILSRVFKIFPPTEIIEIKGMSEILEGLIPYTQRHFSRMDRLIRSTYLLDYTLTGMTVLDPENDLVLSSDAGSLPLEYNHANGKLVEENIGKEEIQLSAGEDVKTSTRKRKSNKSGDHSRKKKKHAVSLNVSAISTEA